MFIIEQAYGNNGYVLWFKLLEILGYTDGHFYDCNNIDNWVYLQAAARISEKECQGILDKLALLGAIDKELWDKKRIIWSDNFIKNITDVYKKRQRKIPQKPFSVPETPFSVSEIRVSDTEIPQSKVKESKINKTKPITQSKLIDNEHEDSPLRPVLDNFLDGLDLDDLYPTGNGGNKIPSPVGGGSVESSNQTGFNDFWQEYPRKSGEDRAIGAWHELTKAGILPSDMIRAARKYAHEVSFSNTPEKYIKMPHRFLADGVFKKYAPKISPNCSRCKGQGYIEFKREDGTTAMRECICKKRFEILDKKDDAL